MLFADLIVSKKATGSRLVTVGLISLIARSYYSMSSKNPSGASPALSSTFAVADVASGGPYFSEIAAMAGSFEKA